MKTFNRKLAGRIFYALVALDAALLVLQHLIPGTWQILPWWIINAPGFVLAVIFGPLLPPSAFALTCMMIVAGLFSALVWSAFFGYVFRRKSVA
jgi:uncharacterized membrane protein